VLDTIGCIIAAKATEIAEITASAAENFNGPANLAYTFGRLADALDFDEGYAGAHFGCGAVGAALALAHQMSGRELLTAVVAGYELGGRIADATGSYLVNSREGASFAPVWGIAAPIVYAAVGTAASSLRLTASTTEQAYGLAGASVPIPVGAKWSAEIDLPNTKYCDSGWSTVAGLIAALTAHNGSTGLPTLLEGDNGLFRMIGALHPNPDALVHDLGRKWCIDAALYKDWPCCGMLFGPLVNLLELKAKYSLPADRIESIVARVPHYATGARFVNPNPTTFVSRQFSLPHAIAMMLLDIPVGPAWLSPALADDARVRNLREKVKVVEDRRVWSSRELNEHKCGPRRKPSGITVVVDETEYSATTELNSPMNLAELPWDDERIIRKFQSIVCEPHASAIVEILMTLELQDDLTGLMEHIAAARPQ
jgi:2-methylcitrate dehydratase PrpD